MTALAPLSPKQIDSIRGATARINLWHGSVRSGKTIASLVCFLLMIHRAPASGLIVICGRSLQTIERNCLDVLADPTLFGKVAAEVHHTRGATTAVILGRVVHLVGAADARAEGRLRGMTASLAYCDEVTLLPAAFFRQLLARLSVPGAKLIGTTNPDSPRHWLRTDYLDRADELDLAAFHFRLADNPSLSEAYVAALAAEFTGLWRRRMILGEWVVAEGSVYDAYDEALHVVDELPAMRRHWVGIDYGTANPFAALLLGLGDDDRLYVVSEWRHDSRAVHRQMTDAQYSRAVRDWLGELDVIPEWTFVDPSAASYSNQLWADGHPGVTRAVNDVIDGIRSVSNALDAGLLRIHRSCEGLLGELPTYVWSEEAAARGEDKPVKKDDHSVDALRYVIHSTAHEWRPLLTQAA
ncbi:PBSX family phage terminase large subunit [Streptomyces sp. NBC_01142]|uniref:PBSX family phage terminase large subunit n=1 Tax=Streptomyces sp. NBC_01142 TaxID=2975865 RepID=UPI00225A78EB|nr:PBSX family phage terminase large subunit [Streptomyces sp. NBC_01142]MCX4818373.1 PBSX family phage terminase large subunit [Streptomyces sp. NBC_01142]